MMSVLSVEIMNSKLRLISHSTVCKKIQDKSFLYVWVTVYGFKRHRMGFPFAWRCHLPQWRPWRSQTLMPGWCFQPSTGVSQTSVPYWTRGSAFHGIWDLNQINSWHFHIKVFGERSSKLCFNGQECQEILVISALYLLFWQGEVYLDEEKPQRNRDGCRKKEYIFTETCWAINRLFSLDALN